MATSFEKLTVPFSLNTNKIAKLVDENRMGPVGVFLLISNVIAVGLATVLYSGQSIGFIPGVDTSLSPTIRFIVGGFFQILMILVYAVAQSVILKLFNIDVSIEKALQLIAYASVWFSVGVIVMTLNLYAGLIFTGISFVSLVFSQKSLKDADTVSAFAGVGFASVATGMIAAAFSLLLSFSA